MSFNYLAQKKNYIYLAFLIPFIYRLVLSTQGIDNTDVGFCNTFYQAIFTAPDTNEFCFIYYLTGLMGGLWESSFGKFGLIGFRFFEAITLTAAVYFLYATFKDRMSQKQSFAAILLSMLFPVIIVTFHYDTLSYLLVAIAAFMYSKYLKTNRNKWLFVTGLMIGFSFFARIVNLSFSILVLLPLLVTTKSKEQRLKACCYMFFGFLGAIITILITMLACNHFDHYIAGLHDAFSTLNRSEATHSKGEMIFRYMKSLKNIILQILIIISIIFLLSKNEQKKYKYKSCIKYLLYLSIFMITLMSMAYLTVLSAALLIVLFCMYQQHKQQDIEFHLSLFLLIATFCFPMGSDIGIQGIFNWCAGLLIFPAINYGKLLKGNTIREVSKVIYICCIICAFCKISYRAYGETASRIHCLSMIRPSRLNVMTEEEKAAKYKKAIATINKYAKTNQPLLLTTQASELYYATNKMPYLGHVQTIIYQGERLERRLEERLHHFKTFPLIAILDKDKEPHEIANEKILKKWMKRYHYKQIYKDDYITIYNQEDFVSFVNTNQHSCITQNKSIKTITKEYDN